MTNDKHNKDTIPHTGTVTIKPEQSAMGGAAPKMEASRDEMLLHQRMDPDCVDGIASYSAEGVLSKYEDREQLQYVIPELVKAETVNGLHSTEEKYAEKVAAVKLLQELKKEATLPMNTPTIAYYNPASGIGALSSNAQGGHIFHIHLKENGGGRVTKLSTHSKGARGREVTFDLSDHSPRDRDFFLTSSKDISEEELKGAVSKIMQAHGQERQRLKESNISSDMPVMLQDTARAMMAKLKKQGLFDKNSQARLIDVEELAAGLSWNQDKKLGDTPQPQQAIVMVQQSDMQRRRSEREGNETVEGIENVLLDKFSQGFKQPSPKDEMTADTVLNMANTTSLGIRN